MCIFTCQVVLCNRVGPWEGPRFCAGGGDLMNTVSVSIGSGSSGMVMESVTDGQKSLHMYVQKRN